MAGAPTVIKLEKKLTLAQMQQKWIAAKKTQRHKDGALLDKETIPGYEQIRWSDAKLAGFWPRAYRLAIPQSATCPKEA